MLERLSRAAYDAPIDEHEPQPINQRRTGVREHTEDTGATLRDYGLAWAHAAGPEKGARLKRNVC